MYSEVLQCYTTITGPNITWVCSSNVIVRLSGPGTGTVSALSAGPQLAVRRKTRNSAGQGSPCKFAHQQNMLSPCTQNVCQKYLSKNVKKCLIFFVKIYLCPINIVSRKYFNLKNNCVNKYLCEQKIFVSKKIFVSTKNICVKITICNEAKYKQSK